MKLKNIHIQRMSLLDLFKYARDRGKRIFLLSIPGNLLILILFAAGIHQSFIYAESLGLSEDAMAGASIFFNTFFISFTGANVFYLLLLDSDTPYFTQVKQAFLKTIKVMPTLFFAATIYCFLYFLGIIFFVIPGMLLYVYLGLFAPTVVFEKKNLLTSLIRSLELVGRSFWKVFGSFLIISSFTMIAALVIGAFFKTFLNGAQVPDVIAFSLPYVLFMPYVGSFYALLYFDLRLRGERFDYELFEQEVPGA